MYEVHIFAATASATDTNIGPYRTGDRHAMLILSRQLAGTEHDWSQAELGAAEAGWTDFRFTRAGTLSAENLNGKDHHFVEAYERAMFGGYGVVVYRDPLEASDEE